MLKWFSGEEGEPGSAAQGSPRGAAEGGEVAVAEMAERLSQTEQLVAQLKELIREKDATLRTQNEQFKVEKEACEAKLSKLRLQNKAKVTSLSAQLEELKNQQGGRDMPTHHKKGVSEGGEQASRGKIVLLKKKVEEMEQQLAQKEEELEKQRKEVASNRQRGEEMDAMLMEKDRKMAEKDAYIIHLQTAMTGDHPVIPALQQKAAEESGAVQQDSGAVQELQLLVQSLTTKVGEAEERYSLLQEQTESLRNLLATEKEQYSQKETMYKQNIQTFKDIILQKDNQLTQVSQMHEQELFRLAAKSDASADLEQLLKALKQKLHEKEEVLLGKAQVIDVLQGEVDGRDEQIKELTERLRRLQVERESLESRMEAEKHVMRAQVRDLMEKHQVEVQRMIEQHQAQMAQTQQDLLRQLEELRKASSLQKSNLEASDSRISPTDSASVERLAELEAQAKHKTDEASKSEAKFLKMKAWSKSRIRQLEEELKKSQSGVAPPDLMALRNRVISLEEEREEYLWKLDQYEELRMKNEMLEAKLVVYEEQQRTLQADLEQFTKRAASQASESGSADDTQSQVLEWQEMVTEAVTARDRAREEKAAMVLRINHMEEEREALATRQRELEEELAQARVLEQHRAKKLAAPAQRSLQEDFDFDGQPPFMDRCSTSESTTPMEGENMGGWWPEYSTPDPDGLRSVVEELELERNQLQEQILSLEERCHDLEDRLQLQARIEALQVTFDVDEDEQPFWVSQNESEKLQNQLASVRLQQTKDAEEHRLLVNSLSDQLKGLSDTQESLESSLIEKENTLAETSEKLELINNLRQSLSEKQIHYKEVSDKLLQTEHTLDTISKKYSSSEKQCSELKIEVGNLTQKLSVLKEKTQKQEVTIDVLQAELDQTNEELDKLNTAHLEERAQLIHELQSCERDIDSLKDLLSEKEKEISTLSGNMTEYVEQVTVLKQEIKLKEETLCDVENALSKAEREAMIIRDSQNSDQQVLNSKITELDGKLKGTEMELFKAKQERETKAAEVEHLVRQAKQDKKTIQDLRSEIQKHTASHRNHLSECETQITSLKEQLALSTRKLQEETEGRTMQLKEKNAVKEKLQQQLHEKEQAYETEVKSFKEEQNKLLMQVQKYGDDVQSLSVQLQVKVQGEERIQKAMQEKLETIARLENHLKEAEDERNKISFDLQARDLENEKLYSEVHSKEDILQSMNIEKLQMQEKLNGLTEELKVKNQMVRQLNDELTSALKLNSSLEKKVDCLTEANEKLQMEVAESVKSISELTLYKESLQAKISMFEAQHLQSTKHIEGLQQDNEKLAARTTELTTVLEQSTNSNSEQLLAKTNECSHLKQLLQAMEEKVKQLQEERQTLISTVNQLQDDLADKEKAVTDLQAQIMVQHSQQMQLQETLSLLREQESDLKSGLLANDAILKLKEEECCSLHNEVVHQKGFVSKLQADAESLKEECEQLHHQINERKRALNDLTQQIQKHEEELSVANKTVMTLRDQLGLAENTARKLESEKSGTIMSLESYEKENASMKQQLDQGQSELASLHARIQEVSNENQRLCAACHSRETELAEKTQIVLDFGVQLKVAQEENSTFNLKISSLTEDNQRLQEDLEQNMKSVSELTAEKGLLEFQISENHKIIDGLLKEKEQIAVAADALKKVLEENELLKSADLLEKTRKCEVLSQEVDALKAQVAQLNSFLNEKELTVLERSTQLQAQQNQLVQLQDTIFMLQEQGSVLKSGLMEKDIIVQQKEEEVRVFQKEVVLQKDLVTHLQDEVESLKRECLEAKVQLEDKGKTLQDVINELQKHKDELKKRSESVISLSSQLGAMNENAAEIETEISNLKTTVQNLSAEKDQSVIEVNECKDKIIVLNEQNAKFKSELQKTVAELSKALAEVTDLKSTVSKKDVQVSDLTQEVKHVFLDKERLNLIIQEKEHSLKQQEDFIQKVNSKNAEQELQLKEKDDDNTKLKMHISKLEESIIKLRGQVDGLVSESSVLKDHLEKKEQLSLECQSSTAVIENLNSNLQAKEAECESLKEQISHLEESVAKLSSTIHVQISEMETLKKSMEGKEAVLLDQWKSLQDMSRRADEALLFKTQYMESTELVAQLQCQIQLLSTECDNLRRSTEETQSAFNNLKEKYAVELEELQDVRRQLSQRTEEVSLHRKLLDDTNSEVEIAKTTIETLRNELSVSHSKLDKAQELNSSISKEKDEALSSHQTSVSLLTVEIERLKSQHIQVVAQMNALTENLEQREMALHAINKQYTAQAKHSAQLLSEVQQLKSRNKRVSQENAGSLAELQKQLSLGELHVQMEQQSSSMTQRMEKMVLEKESLQTENNRQMSDYLQKMEQRMQTSTPQHEKEVGRSQEEITDFRSDVCRQQNEFQTAKEPTDKKEAQLLKQEAGALAGRGRSEEVVSRLETERIQLHRDLQRCMYEIQQRDQYFQQLNVKLQQVMEEKGVVAAQLRAVSETLRNTQNHCHWLENQGQAQGALFAEDAPGAPQERSSLSITMETDEASQLRERLVEVEQSLSEERSRREMAEEALRLLEDRTKSVGTSVSRDRPNDFSIHLEAEEEWEALSLNPNQPLISRKVKGGMAACRQWLRGRSLYFSKLLMSRGRARYLFLAYLLTLHVLVFMCLSGAL
ncbi:golgin subfamily B member 1 isoform X1 [Thalassophryne amazonica]|uniref:golgin subfamily B member 1 isoform X1 n=1 Tax=Thalassophryne amazonica TaxID=390379 RepID=UPI001471AAD0|nr:golgin subfamily B member 1 isoform X1 [Thalassophryne amazonica]